MMRKLPVVTHFCFPAASDPARSQIPAGHAAFIVHAVIVSAAVSFIRAAAIAAISGMLKQGQDSVEAGRQCHRHAFVDPVARWRIDVQTRVKLAARQ